MCGVPACECGTNGVCQVRLLIRSTYYIQTLPVRPLAGDASPQRPRQTRRRLQLKGLELACPETLGAPQTRSHQSSDAALEQPLRLLSGLWQAVPRCQCDTLAMEVDSRSPVWLLFSLPRQAISSGAFHAHAACSMKQSLLRLCNGCESDKLGGASVLQDTFRVLPAPALSCPWICTDVHVLS